MMTIARLFGKSPFAPLQTHMNKVASCIEKLTKIFESLAKGDSGKIKRYVEELSQLEHEADLTKNDIRNHLPKSLFMPIDRSHFLDILSLQDSIADTTEDIGIILTLRSLEEHKQFGETLTSFFSTCCEVFWYTKRIIEEIDELLESAFGGIEAEKVKTMVEETALKEHIAQTDKNSFLKLLYQKGDHLPASAFYHWIHLIEKVGMISTISEKLTNRIRMVLELK